MAPIWASIPIPKVVEMQEAPFIVGKPVTGEYFVDWEEELRHYLNMPFTEADKAQMLEWTGGMHER
jgi:hypothetical protein